MGGDLSIRWAHCDRPEKKHPKTHSSRPGTGVVAVILHPYLGNDSKYLEPSWSYDYGTDPQQIEAVVETVDRHIVDAFTGGYRRYHSATVEVIDRPHAKADYNK